MSWRYGDWNILKKNKDYEDVDKRNQKKQDVDWWNLQIHGVFTKYGWIYTMFCLKILLDILSKSPVSVLACEISDNVGEWYFQDLSQTFGEGKIFHALLIWGWNLQQKPSFGLLTDGCALLISVACMYVT